MVGSSHLLCLLVEVVHEAIGSSMCSPIVGIDTITDVPTDYQIQKGTKTKQVVKKHSYGGGVTEILVSVAAPAAAAIASSLWFFKGWKAWPWPYRFFIRGIASRTC